jgi:hypothetical protein
VTRTQLRHLRRRQPNGCYGTLASYSHIICILCDLCLTVRVTIFIHSWSQRRPTVELLTVNNNDINENNTDHHCLQRHCTRAFLRRQDHFADYQRRG